MTRANIRFPRPVRRHEWFYRPGYLVSPVEDWIAQNFFLLFSNSGERWNPFFIRWFTKCAEGATSTIAQLRHSGLSHNTAGYSERNSSGSKNTTQGHCVKCDQARSQGGGGGSRVRTNPPPPPPLSRTKKNANGVRTWHLRVQVRSIPPALPQAYVARNRIIWNYSTTISTTNTHVHFKCLLDWRQSVGMPAWQEVWHFSDDQRTKFWTSGVSLVSKSPADGQEGKRRNAVETTVKVMVKVFAHTETSSFSFFFFHADVDCSFVYSSIESFHHPLHKSISVSPIDM